MTRFAARTAGMTASEIRALFAVASRPEVVSLAGRHAQPRRAAAGRAGRRGRRARRPRRPGGAAVRLGAGRARAARADLRGDGARRASDAAPRRRRGHRRLAAWRSTSSPGSSATRATSCSPRVRPTSARSAASPPYQARVVHVAMDDARAGAGGAARGAGRLAAARRAGRSSSTRCPNFHNPAGVTLAVERRAEMLDDLRASTACWSSRTTRTGCSGSTAQTLSGAAVAGRRTASSTSARSPRRSRPGLRVGWALAPHAVRDKLVLAAESATLCPPTLQPAARVALPVDTRLARARSRRSREVYRERRDAMLAALETLHARRVARGPSRTAGSTCG